MRRLHSVLFLTLASCTNGSGETLSVTADSFTPSTDSETAGVPDLTDGEPTETNDPEPTTGGPAPAEKILFRSDRDGSLRLYWMDRDGANQVVLTKAIDDSGVFRWTPDGSGILYARDGDVWLLDPESGKESNATPDHTVSNLLDVAPDGTWLLMSGGAEGGDGYGLFRIGLSDANNLLLNEWGVIKPVVNSAEISPDSTRAAYLGHLGSDRSVVVLADDASSKVVVATSPAFINTFDPSWSPDSAMIAFSGAGMDDETNQIYVVGPDGMGVQRLTSSTFSRSPHWTPDGQRIVFTRSDTDISGDTIGPWIVVMNRDGSEQTDLTPGDLYCIEPALSSDGAWIAIQCKIQASGAQMNIYMVPITGGTPTQLTSNTRENEFPQWRP